METRIHGNLSKRGLEVVERDGRYFVRYDAGAHQIAWREDELFPAEFEQLKTGEAGEYQTIIGLQRRLLQAGIDPHVQNWRPENV